MVQWLCDCPDFLALRVPNLYNYSFLIEMTLQTCKTRYNMRQRHRLTQTLTHDKGAARQPCDSHAGALRLSQEPKCHLAIFFAKK